MIDPRWPDDLSRRTFFKSVGAMGAAFAAAGCAAPSPAARAGVGSGWTDRVGVQLYTVRDAMERDLPGTLERVARIGFREVEFAGYFGRPPEEVRQIIDSVGLRAPSSHIDISLLRSDLPGQLRIARTIGNEFITVPALQEGFAGPLDLAFWQRIAQEFNRFGATARQSGIGLAYHNHAFEFDRLPDGRTGWDVLLSETDPALVSFELDLLWAVFANRDPVQLFQASPGRYVMWHVKDIRGLEEGRRVAAAATTPRGVMAEAISRLAAVGEGDIDFRRVFSQAAVSGMRHFFVENDAAPQGDSLANIEASYRNLTGMLAG